MNPQQKAFAARIRDPLGAAVPEQIPAERMAIYERLFFNANRSFFDSGFPVLREVLGEARWQRLVRAFLRDHASHTPYFLEIGQSFLDWLEGGFVAEPDDPAFLFELAHYERVELALDISSAELPGQGWSPLAWPLAYRWPVQRLCAAYRPDQPPAEATLLLAWRDAEDRVRFQQLAPFAWHLACRLQDGQGSAEALLAQAGEAGMAADEAYFAQAAALLQQWHEQSIWCAPGAD
jgi:hypothetical protein